MANDAEQRLIAEISKLANDIRELRQPGARRDGPSLQTLEAQSRTKWDELRVVRAGPVDADAMDHSRSSRR